MARFAFSSHPSLSQNPHNIQTDGKQKEIKNYMELLREKGNKKNIGSPHNEG